MKRFLFLLTIGGSVSLTVFIFIALHAETGINLFTPGRVAGKLFQPENGFYG